MKISLSLQVPSKAVSPPERSPPPRFPSHSYHRERCSVSRALFYRCTKSLVNEPPLQFPQWGTYAERCPSPQPSFTYPSGPLVKKLPSRFFLHSYHRDAPFSELSFICLSGSLVKELSHEIVGNIWSLSMEPQTDRRPTYNAVWSGSPRGLFMILLSLSQCHAACSTITSNLAWVDQSTVRQCVSQEPTTGCPLCTCYHLPFDPGYRSPCKPEVRMRGWIYGRQNGGKADVSC